MANVEAGRRIRMSRNMRGVIASSISASHSKRRSTIAAFTLLNGSDWCWADISHAWRTFETSGISAVGSDFAFSTSQSTSHVQPKPLGTIKSPAPDGTAMDG